MNENTTTASLGSIGYSACTPSQALHQGCNLGALGACPAVPSENIKQEVFTVGGILAIMELLEEVSEKLDIFIDTQCATEDDLEIEEEGADDYTFSVRIPLDRKMTLEEALDKVFTK